MSSNRRDDRQSGNRGRDQGTPQETNKSDAKSIRCRLFIGNLNTDSLARQELEDIFGKHGRIVGCSLHNGFGFIQYEKESEADEAVKKQHGTIINERRVFVNLAGDRRKPDDRGKRPGSFRRKGRPSGLDRPRDRSPSPGRRGIDVPFGAPGYREGRDRLRDDPYFKDPLDRPDRGPLGPPLKRSPYSPPRDVYKKLDDHLRPDSYSRPPMDDIPPKRMKPDYDFLPDSREPPHNRPVGTPIDCEVIIINKQQRGYADVVEKKLKVHGLVVECAHLPESVTLLAELEDASRRGVLYGIIISSQHEVHHSVTVHILHGTQQEHRNMPLEDAVTLVSRNFEQYMQNLREREREREQERPVSVEPLEAAEGYGAGNPAPDPGAPMPNTPEIRQLLNMAADGKYLTANQCTLLINEFTRLRDELLKKEGRPAPAVSAPKSFPTDPQSIALQQAELQAKILSILNPMVKSTNGVKAATQDGVANSVAAQSSQVKFSAAAEGNPASKIPVLTPSYAAASAFGAPRSSSSASGQAAPSQTRASGGGGGTQYANQILGMAFSNMRSGGAAQSPSTNQLQGSASYAKGSQSPYSGGAGAAGAGARSVASPARSQAQLRAPSTTSVARPAMEAGSGANSYGGRGHYSSPQNTGYRQVVPSGYPKRY